VDVGYPYYVHQNGARPETPAGEADAVKKVVEDTLVRGLMQDGTKEQVLAVWVLSATSTSTSLNSTS